MKKVPLHDKVWLVTTKTDAFGNYTVDEAVYIKAAYFPGSISLYQGGYQNTTVYDAHCYLDETDPFVLKNHLRLESFYLVCNLYGNKNEQEWYRIRQEQPGVTKITDNVINNIHCYLIKAMPIEGMSFPDTPTHPILPGEDSDNIPWSLPDPLPPESSTSDSTVESDKEPESTPVAPNESEVIDVRKAFN